MLEERACGKESQVRRCARYHHSNGQRGDPLSICLSIWSHLPRELRDWSSSGRCLRIGEDKME